MKLDLQRPLTYLITSGRLTPDARPGSPAFDALLQQTEAAIAARISLIQIREKQASARTLCELTSACAALTRASATRLLINDRADIAHACGADGVHLTTRSIPARIVRETFGDDFLIGVSTHNTNEATAAHDAGADFATFSPIYETPSKSHLGLPPIGLNVLSETARRLAPFPLIALGGINMECAGEVLRAGAAGVAGIRLFDETQDLNGMVQKINEQRT